MNDRWRESTGARWAGLLGDVPLKFVIVPGESIGPFRLGMTEPEASQLMEQLQIPRNVGAQDGGVTMSFDALGHATQITVAAKLPNITFVLSGKEVQTFDKRELRAQLAKTVPLTSDGRIPSNAGIDLLLWEMSDPDVIAFMVSPILQKTST